MVRGDPALPFREGAHLLQAALFPHEDGGQEGSDQVSFSLPRRLVSRGFFEFSLFVLSEQHGGEVQCSMEGHGPGDPGIGCLRGDGEDPGPLHRVP